MGYLGLDLSPLRCHTLDMEIRKPRHNLERFKLEALNGTLEVAVSAYKGAIALGFESDDIRNEIRLFLAANILPCHFYKSMTSYHDSKQWQDVYYIPYKDNVSIYVKFTDGIISEFNVTSFKEA